MPLFRSNAAKARFFAVVTLLGAVSSAFAAEKKSQSFDTENTKPSALSIAKVPDATELRLLGPDARLQLVVTGHLPGKRQSDWTRKVQYSSRPAGVVSVDRRGSVTPLADGSATIEVASPEGLRASVEVVVEQFAEPPAVNFPNQVVPVFTKLGCNSGACHGKSGGQNGFALSLLGFEPQEDFTHLVKEARGRRVFPGSPERSLLLLKATAALPHGGGPRLAEDSDDYRVISRWIQQGMPFGKQDDPTVTSLSVWPRERKLDRGAAQQLRVLAHYSDGSAHDVTSRAQYDTNNKELAEVKANALVQLLGKPGQVAVMVRYQGQVAVFEAIAPLGAPVRSLPPENNFVDKHVYAKLIELGMPPSAISDDVTFVRRVTIDITGRLPTSDFAKAFLADTSADKRRRLIDSLLESDAYADYFALKWGAILKNRTMENNPRKSAYLFSNWLVNQLRTNVPYDELVRQILTAAGPVEENPAVNWYGHVREVNTQVEDTAQLFLGLRIQCARCHHHPFEKWSQKDYWGLAAFFSTVRVESHNESADYRVRVAFESPQSRNPKDGAMVKPTVLGGEALAVAQGDDARVELVDWLTDAKNPYFAKSLVNRYWKHFFNRGIVDPEDDMRATNPPSNPALLDALAKSFIDSKYDLKQLVREICNSTTYQLSSTPNEWNGADTQSFSRYYPRRMPAEVMLDGVDQFLGTNTQFNAIPVGTRAVQIPDFGKVTNQFLDTFGRPAGGSSCECERGGDVTMSQSLQLLNSDEIHNKLSNAPLRSAESLKDRESTDVISELYLRAVSRPPTANELATFTAYIDQAKAEQKSQAYEDILWALINTKEFLFNH